MFYNIYEHPSSTELEQRSEYKDVVEVKIFDQPSTSAYSLVLHCLPANFNSQFIIGIYIDGRNFPLQRERPFYE